MHNITIYNQSFLTIQIELANFCMKNEVIESLK